MEVDITTKKEETTEPKTEHYEDWKKRILENAYKQLKKLQTVDKHNKQNHNLNKESGSPTKRKQNEHLRRTLVLKLERISPRKHNKHIEKSNERNVILNKQNDNSNKQNDNPNKQNDNSNEKIANSNRKILIFDTQQMVTRRSPRKTPQKFEPYKSPTKIKGGVRVLFPSSK